MRPNAAPWRSPILFAVGSAAATATTLLLLWVTRQMLLLVFAGVLLAVLLGAAARPVQRRLRMGRAVALATVTTAAALLVTIGTWLHGAEFAAQFAQLGERMPQAVAELRAWLMQYAWGQVLVSRAALARDAGLSALMGRISTALSSTLTIGAVLFVVVFLGYYLAAEPLRYLRGAVRLLPVDMRHRGQQVADALVRTLHWWLVAKLIEMASVGILATIALLVLGIPMAVPFGIITTALTFIPTIGPLLAAAGPVLIGFTISPGRAVAAALAYWLVYALQGFIIAPLVERRAVHVPPAFTMGLQVFLAITSGALGVALAAPLAAVLLVLVRMVYVEDVLGDRAS
ncbi:MAG TPA: AI-2E family transporter [Gemmatimonadaceae bacterium]|nr:AI-2E family transporter [Gemmatimonadaceae bacterium]